MAAARRRLRAPAASRCSWRAHVHCVRQLLELAAHAPRPDPQPSAAEHRPDALARMVLDGRHRQQAVDDELIRLARWRAGRPQRWLTDQPHVVDPATRRAVSRRAVAAELREQRAAGALSRRRSAPRLLSGARRNVGCAQRPPCTGSPRAGRRSAVGVSVRRRARSSGSSSAPVVVIVTAKRRRCRSLPYLSEPRMERRRELSGCAVKESASANCIEWLSGRVQRGSWPLPSSSSYC